MTGRIPARLVALLAASLATMCVLAFGVASASALASVRIYDNIPRPLPGNLPSMAFEATSTSEFGGQVELVGAQRKNPEVFATLSSWACGNLQGGAACSTAPRQSFAWPITLNVYEVGAGNAPGAKIASVTKTFEIPFRPSPNKKCQVTSEGVVGWGPHCYPGKTHGIGFQLPGVMLPAKVIISIAFNTTDYGYAPTHEPSVGEDSLNVAVREPGESGPAVGADPVPADAYVNSSWEGAYCNGAEGTGTFRLDAGCWNGLQPAFEVRASK